MNHLFLKIYIWMQNLTMREDGQDLIEYALLIAIIAVGAVGTLDTLRGKIITVFTTIGNDL